MEIPIKNLVAIVRHIIIVLLIVQKMEHDLTTGQEDIVRIVVES